MSMNENIVHSENHVHRDDEGARIGMWLFLFTELLLFGGLFLVYAVYRFQYPEQFHLAAMEMNVAFGTLNTIILLTSSLTVVLSIGAIQKKNKFLSILYLVLTLVFAFLFLVNKFFEWSHEISKGIFPGGEVLLSKSNGEILFFGLYYTMTGLHALHIIIGMIFLAFILVFIIRDKITFDNNVKLENAGLYWHLVDAIWIFLFPLFYLIK